MPEYLARIVTKTLEEHRRGGAVAEKFEAAYLRSLDFEKADRDAAERIYAQFHGRGVPPDTGYKTLQDYLFHYVAAECGRLGMAVHLHTQAGRAAATLTCAAPIRCCSSQCSTIPSCVRPNSLWFMAAGPLTARSRRCWTKPNAYLDISSQTLLLSPATLGHSLREWLEWTPDKVLFGTDAYPYSEGLGWEESAWLAAQRGREALGTRPHRP